MMDMERSEICIEVINKIDEIYWEYYAQSWFHLQDYIEMQGHHNIKKKQFKYSVYALKTKINLNYI